TSGSHSTTTPQSGKSGWSNSAKKYPDAPEPLPAPDNSPLSDPTLPPQPNTEPPSSTPSPNWPKADPGCPPPNHLTSYVKRSFLSQRRAEQVTEGVDQQVERIVSRQRQLGGYPRG